MLTPKAMRTNKKMSQQEVADKMSEYLPMTHRMYVDRENGIVKWSAEELAAFAIVTGYTDITDYDLT